MFPSKAVQFLGMVAFAIGLPGCVTTGHDEPSLSAGEVALMLPAELKDRMGWAEDIVFAVGRADRSVTAERACAVIAVLQQESGFQSDPAVRNLPAIVRKGLEDKFSKLGPLAGPAVEAVLHARAPGAKDNFEKRIAKLKTESDLDRLYRDLQDSLRDRFPGSIAVASAVTKLLGKGWLEDLNPVTTAGSMQVKVSFAKTVDGFKDLSDAEARDLLYTRKGGVVAGTARLLGYEAGYDDVIYRFADYNAGMYSSRNAAFQQLLSDVGGTKLVPDGDLLAYEADDDPTGTPTESVKAMMAFAAKNDLSDREVRRAANHEKTLDFEDYDLWTEVRKSWEKKTGRKPPYARIPAVTLISPKLATTRSTEWFAKSVKRHYDVCRKR